MCDNTFATPLVARPLDLGADVVVHSATKYLCGHSDVLLGVAVTRADRAGQALHERLLARRSRHGGMAGPIEAWLALRGLRTLAVRLERASASAATLGRATGRPPGSRNPGCATRASGRCSPSTWRARPRTPTGWPRPACPARRDQPRWGRVARGAAAALPGRVRAGPRDAAAAVRGHRGRRGPVGGSRPGAGDPGVARGLRWTRTPVAVGGSGYLSSRASRRRAGPRDLTDPAAATSMPSPG